MAKKWSEVAASPAFQALSAADQDAARQQYFAEVVAPRVPDRALAEVKDQFDADTRIRKQDLPEGVKPSVAGAGRGISRGAEVAPAPAPASRALTIAAPTATAAAPTAAMGDPSGSDLGAAIMAQQPEDAYIQSQPASNVTTLERTPPPGITRPLTTDEAIYASRSPENQQQERDRLRYLQGDGSTITALDNPSLVSGVLRRLDRKPLDQSFGGAALEVGADAARGLAKAGPGLATAAYGGVEAAADAAGASDIANWAARSAKAGKNYLTKLDNPNGDSLVTGAFQSLGSAAIGGAVAGAEGAALTAFGQTAGEKYTELRAGGLGFAPAVEGAAVHGLAELLGERVGMHSLGRLVEGVAARTGISPLRALKESLIQQGEEQATLAMQTVYDKIGSGTLGSGATLDQYLKDVVDTAAQTAIMTAAAGGAGGIARGAQALVKPTPYDRAALRGFNVEPPLTTDDPVTLVKRRISAFQNAAAKYGIPPDAVKRAVDTAKTLPAEKVGNFLADVAQALRKRDVYKVDPEPYVLDTMRAAPVEPPPEPAKPGEKPEVPPATGQADEAVNNIAALLGTPIDEAAHAAAPSPKNDWTKFNPESGTIGVPRAEMPQVKASDRSALVQFLRARGVDYAPETDVPAGDLKPTQAEFSPAKVEQARGFTDTNRSILVSSDGHVVDGHHQWLAKMADDAPVSVIRLNAPIADLLPMVRDFPSAFSADYNDGNDQASNVQKPGVERLAAREAQVQRSEESRLPGVRGEGDQDAPVVGGRLPAVPAGDRAKADAGALSRPDQGTPRVRAGQRPVGDKGAAVAEPAGVRSAADTSGQDADGRRVGSRVGSATDDAVRSAEQGNAGGAGAADRQDAGRAQPPDADAPRPRNAAEGVGARTRNGVNDDSGAPEARLDGGKGVDATRQIGTAGTTPKTATPIELRANDDGSLTPWHDGAELLDYESGDPVRIPANATDQAALDAIKAAGSFGRNTKVFRDKPAASKDEPATYKGQPVASWVIRERDSKKPVKETFERADADKVAESKKYEAVPVQQHLAELNKAIKAGKTPAWASGGDPIVKPTATPPAAAPVDKAAETPVDKSPKSRTSRPGAAQKGASADRNPFRAFLGRRGISLDVAADFAPGQAERRKAMVPGYGPIFRKNGMQLDELAQRAAEDGFLRPGTQDVAELNDMIQRSLRGERIAPLYAEGVAEAEMQARAEREIQDAEDAALELEAVPDDTLADIADLWNGDAPPQSMADAMRAMGFSDQEITDAANRPEEQAASQGDRGAAEAAAGGREAGNPRGDEVQGPAAEEGLTSPTAAELEATARRTRDADAADRKEQKRLADKADADATRGEFTLTGSDRPADVAAAAGQGDIFSPPPAPVTKKPSAAAQKRAFANDFAALAGRELVQTVPIAGTTQTATLRVDAAQAMRMLEKREQVLRELRDCIGRAA